MEEVFDFYEEIKKSYYFLVPERDYGLILIDLFERYESQAFTDGCFTEDNIREAIRLIKPVREREQKEQQSQIIRDLQKHFIQRVGNNKYKFRNYGLAFCQLIKEHLRADFSATEIEKICYELARSLEDIANLDNQQVEEFSSWAHYKFFVYQPRFSEQVDTLERQIDRSVEQLQLKVKSRDEEVLLLLETVNFQLDDIKQKWEEIRNAFRGTDKIKNIINQSIILWDLSEDAINLIEKINLALDDIYEKLEAVNERLGSIQPKIRQFIASTVKRLTSRV